MLFEDALENGARREIAREILLILTNFENNQDCIWETIMNFFSFVEENKKVKLIKFLIHKLSSFDKLSFIANELLTISEDDINEIKKEASSIMEKKRSGYNSYPDNDKSYIELCLFLKLFGKIEDISFLEPAKEKYSFLKCIFEPKNFDVTTINFQERIWSEIFENDDYRENIILVNNNKEKIEEMLLQAINNGNAGFFENQMFFRYFFRNSKD